MPIPVQCPGCSVRLSAPDAAAGKTVKCPKCKTAIPIPAPAAKPAPAFEVVEDAPAPAPAVMDAEPVQDAEPVDQFDFNNAPARPKKGRPADEDDEDDRPRRTRRDEDDDRPRQRRRRDEDDEDDDRPRKKPVKKAGLSPALLYGGIAAGVLLLGGVGFAVYWWGIRDKPKETAGAGDPNNPNSPGGGSRTPPPSTWVAFAAPEAGFKAYFPEKPRDFKIGSEKSYTANGSKVECKVTVRTGSPAELDEEMKKIITFTPWLGQNPDRRDVTLAGRPATEVAGKDTPSNNPARRPPPIATVRFLKTDTALYAVTIVSSSGPLPDDVVKGYFDSFELIPVSGPPADPGKKTP